MDYIQSPQDQPMTQPAQPQQQDYQFVPQGSSQAQLQQQISSLPPEAADIDLIEKEWVLHLEHIIAQTSHDPYLQQAEISKAKAEYLRKRYGKEVKVTEG